MDHDGTHRSLSANIQDLITNELSYRKHFMTCIRFAIDVIKIIYHLFNSENFENRLSSFNNVSVAYISIQRVRVFGRNGIPLFITLHGFHSRIQISSGIRPDRFNRHHTTSYGRAELPPWRMFAPDEFSSVSRTSRRQ